MSNTFLDGDIFNRICSPRKISQWMLEYGRTLESISSFEPTTSIFNVQKEEFMKDLELILRHEIRDVTEQIELIYPHIKDLLSDSIF